MSLLSNPTTISDFAQLNKWLEYFDDLEGDLLMLWADADYSELPHLINSQYTADLRLKSLFTSLLNHFSVHVHACFSTLPASLRFTAFRHVDFQLISRSKALFGVLCNALLTCFSSQTAVLC